MGAGTPPPASTPPPARTSRTSAVTPPAGVSVWVQGLTRPMLTGGDLADLVTIGQVAGVGTDPAAVAAAITDGAYRDQLQELARAGAGLQEAVQAVLVQDAGAACQVLAPVFERSGGTDGWVCLPVDAHLAGDTTGTLAAARRLWAQVDRPNLMVTLPATPAGLPAISAVLADGVSVNAALACSVTGYRAVLNAVLVGLEQARRNGRDLSGIHAVASLCVCAVDAEVDHRLDALEGVSARARGQWLRGQAGIANAHLAYRAYEQALTTPALGQPACRRRPDPAPAVGLHRHNRLRLPRHPAGQRAGHPARGDQPAPGRAAGGHRARPVARRPGPGPRPLPRGRGHLERPGTPGRLLQRGHRPGRTPRRATGPAVLDPAVPPPRRAPRARRRPRRRLRPGPGTGDRSEPGAVIIDLPATSSSARSCSPCAPGRRW